MSLCQTFTCRPCFSFGWITYFTFLRLLKREQNNWLVSDTDGTTAQFKSVVNTGSRHVYCAAELILNSGMRCRLSSDLLCSFVFTVLIMCFYFKLCLQSKIPPKEQWRYSSVQFSSEGFFFLGMQPFELDARHLEALANSLLINFWWPAISKVTFYIDFDKSCSLMLCVFFVFFI